VGPLGHHEGDPGGPGERLSSNDGFAPKTTGLRRKGGSPSSQDVQLSNHYVYLEPDGIFSSTHAYPVAEVPPRPIPPKDLPRPPYHPPGWDGVQGEEDD
jgi:hypothetical protein